MGSRPVASATCDRARSFASVLLDLEPQHPTLKWVADAIRSADCRRLTTEDLSRIDAYQGQGQELHELLPAILPRDRASWFEVEITAQHGTRMLMGHLAVPAVDGLDIGFLGYAPAYGRIIGPLGPALMNATELVRPHGCSDEAWRELRASAGIIVRALMLGCGERIEDAPH